MNVDAISIGANPPHEVNVVIEVPIGGEPIKYEMDKKVGALVVDRFLYTSMRYPGNYGFIPHTLSERYARIHNFTDLPEITLKQIEHFFAHYKDLEPNKWVKITRWGDAEEARAMVLAGIERAAQAK
jgi:inorganic pyrophosphatase